MPKKEGPSVSRKGGILKIRRKDNSVAWRIRWHDSEGKRCSETVEGKRIDAQRRLDTRLREAEQERVGLRLRPKEPAPDLVAIALRADEEVLPLTQRPQQRLSTLRIIRDWWVPFHGRPVDEIKTPEIRAILAKKRAEGLTPGTCNRALYALSAVLEAAREWEYIDRNPCRGANLRQKEGVKAPRHLSADEATRLLKTADEFYRAVFGVAIYAGLRLGEVRALRWADIDRDEGKITVRRSNNDIPKSGHHRVIPLHPNLAEILPPFTRHTELVFKSPRTGGMISTPRKALKYALLDAGIERHISFHDLRHTFATLMVQGGTDLKTLQRLLGHSTINMTLRYVHFSQDTQDAILNLPIN